MSEEATIEEEADYEQPSTTTRPQTETGLLKWSYIIEYATKQWVMFLIFSIVVGVFLYVSAKKQRRKDNQGRESIRQDHIQGGTQGVSRRSLKRD